MDPFKSYQDQPFAPARRFYLVVPADGADLPSVPKGIICTGGGLVQIVGDDGVQVALPVNPNTVYPVQPQRIKATATTATGIIALL